MRYESSGELVKRSRLGGHEPSPVLVEVILPGMRSSVTGAAFGLLVGFVARLWRWPLDDASMMGIVGGLLVFLVAWCWPGSRKIKENPTLQKIAENDRSSGKIVLLSPRTDDKPPTEGERLAAFVEVCQVDTSTRRLEGLGYSRAEIDRYRSYLMRSNWAAWLGPDRRRGWALVGNAQDILEAMG